jgi:hypothetical protein
VRASTPGNRGQAEYKYPAGELSMVNIAMAGMGTKRIRVAGLPPEVSNDTLSASLAPYGKTLDVHHETWTRAYKYTVFNGVRQVTMCLSKHIPCHLTVADQRILLSYEGQPATCYGCGEAGHMYQGCPVCRRPGAVRPLSTRST